MNKIHKVYMKYYGLLLGIILLSACSEGQVEELVFRKTLEYDLVGTCEDDKACINAVKSQVGPCMEKSRWREYLENQDSEEALERFSVEFYACIVDDEGNPYFD